MADQKLNVDTSIVDYLKSTNADSSFANRTKLATQYGIANYTGSAEQNIALLGKVKGGAKAPATTVAPVVTTTKTVTPAVTTENQKVVNPDGTISYNSGANIDPTKITSPSDANSYINSDQQTNFNTASATDAPPVKSTLADTLGSLTKSITENLPKKVEAPKLVDTYNQLRLDQGVSTLETNLNDLKKEANDIKSQFKMQVDSETGKPVAMNVIEGRVSEEEKTANQRLTAITDQMDAITNTLKTKYDTIETVMKLTESDYQNSSDSYDKQLTQNLQLINAAKGIVDTQNSQAEQAKDDARANLQIIYNSINSGATNVGNLSGSDKLNIAKLELQAGLPQGFYANITNKNPKADILSTTTRETNGTKYADVIMRNEDGSLTTKSILIGKTSASSGSEKDQVKADATTVASQLDSVAGGDGYISPTDYMKARKAWVSAGYTAKDFDDRFAKSYVNPDQYGDVGVDL